MLCSARHVAGVAGVAVVAVRYTGRDVISHDLMRFNARCAEAQPAMRYERILGEKRVDRESRFTLPYWESGCALRAGPRKSTVVGVGCGGRVRLVVQLQGGGASCHVAMLSSGRDRAAQVSLLPSCHPVRDGGCARSSRRTGFCDSPRLIAADALEAGVVWTLGAPLKRGFLSPPPPTVELPGTLLEPRPFSRPLFKKAEIDGSACPTLATSSRGPPAAERRGLWDSVTFRKSGGRGTRRVASADIRMSDAVADRECLFSGSTPPIPAREKGSALLAPLGRACRTCDPGRPVSSRIRPPTGQEPGKRQGQGMMRHSKAGKASWHSKAGHAIDDGMAPSPKLNRTFGHGILLHDTGPSTSPPELIRIRPPSSWVGSRSTRSTGLGWPGLEYPGISLVFRLRPFHTPLPT
ncbi:hypothetical protein JHW43_007128 [Diplocarpon mali]|nr:hypothetical protein JHW43_007128 [Diplocarpon mali]